MMDKFKKLFEGASWVGNVIASVFLTGVALLMTVQIVGRYVFNHPIPGAFEIITAAMAVLTSIGFAFALVQQRHIRVTIFTEKLSLRAQHFVLQATYLIGFIVAGVMDWQLLLGAIKSIGQKEYSMGIVPVPIYLSRSILVFSVFLFCVAFLYLFVNGFRNRSKSKDTSGGQL